MKLRRGTYIDFRLSPSHLMKLVIAGKAKIVGKDKYGRRIYEMK
jgi:hypothetical protein